MWALVTGGCKGGAGGSEQAALAGWATSANPSAVSSSSCHCSHFFQMKNISFLTATPQQLVRLPTIPQARAAHMQSAVSPTWLHGGPHMAPALFRVRETWIRQAPICGLGGKTDTQSSKCLTSLGIQWTSLGGSASTEVSEILLGLGGGGCSRRPLYKPRKTDG